MDATLPLDFRFAQRRDGRLARTLRAVATRVAGFDPEPSDALVDAFRAAYYRGDELADPFVREAFSRGGLHAARRLLDRALREGSARFDDAPPSLAALLADVEARPAWVDDDEVALGAKTFRRYGSAVFRFAGAITLAGYRESSVAKPLALSGAYVGAGTRARFLETASFWIEVSEPGGLARGAPGFLAALHVRLLHATVRLRLENHREWNVEAWGVPINQGDALLTLMGGSIAPGLGMRLVGFRPTRREIEAMLHFWRYVGHLMGVRFEPYPETVEEALRISYVALLKGTGGAGEDGRALCQSYVDAFTPREGGALAWLEHGVHRGMTRLFLPPSVYREQGLPDVGLWPLVPLLPFPLVYAAETLRRRMPMLEPLADALARRERRAWLARHARGKAAAFRPQEGLRR